MCDEDFPELKWGWGIEWFRFGWRRRLHFAFAIHFDRFAIGLILFGYGFQVGYVRLKSPMMTATIRPQESFHGSYFSRLGPVAVCCISPEARELLDRIEAAWEKHKKELPEKLTCGDETWDPRESIYGFAYWLVRWSGLIRPA